MPRPRRVAAHSLTDELRRRRAAHKKRGKGPNGKREKQPGNDAWGFAPVEIRGEPVSETLIRERRQ